MTEHLPHILILGLPTLFLLAFSLPRFSTRQWIAALCLLFFVVTSTTALHTAMHQQEAYGSHICCVLPSGVVPIATFLTILTGFIILLRQPTFEKYTFLQIFIPNNKSPPYTS